MANPDSSKQNRKIVPSKENPKEEGQHAESGLLTEAAQEGKNNPRDTPHLVGREEAPTLPANASGHDQQQGATKIAPESMYDGRPEESKDFEPSERVRGKENA